MLLALDRKHINSLIFPHFYLYTKYVKYCFHSILSFRVTNYGDLKSHGGHTTSGTIFKYFSLSLQNQETTKNKEAEVAAISNANAKVSIVEQQIPDEDNRFEIPTDQSSLQQKSDVLFTDGNSNNGNNINANNTELYSTQSNDLETRLK